MENTENVFLEKMLHPLNFALVQLFERMRIVIVHLIGVHKYEFRQQRRFELVEEQVNVTNLDEIKRELLDYGKFLFVGWGRDYAQIELDEGQSVGVIEVEFKFDQDIILN